MGERPGSRNLRCAIYTRKSSEEGLEQDFNSLHAQREACEAFIVSQKQEGWQPVPDTYDDGGFSGGSMERQSDFAQNSKSSSDMSSSSSNGRFIGLSMSASLRSI
jgi:hypothetical protein